MNRDKIVISGLTFYGYHGVHPEEKVLGQRFTVDVEIGLDRAVIAIDGIEVGDLDYVDVGKPMGASEVIPVTVKSLVFSLRSQSG